MKVRLVYSQANSLLLVPKPWNLISHEKWKYACAISPTNSTPTLWQKICLDLWRWRQKGWNDLLKYREIGFQSDRSSIQFTYEKIFAYLREFNVGEAEMGDVRGSFHWTPCICLWRLFRVYLLDVMSFEMACANKGIGLGIDKSEESSMKRSKHGSGIHSRRRQVTDQQTMAPILQFSWAIWAGK